MGTPLLELVLLPFVGALALLALCRGRLDRTASSLAGAVLLGTLALALPALSEALRGGTATVSLPWVPSLGLAFSLALDGLSLVFVSLVLGIGLLVVLYAHYYLGPDEPRPRFFATLLLFTGAMLGVVLSANLLLLVVFWELTSLASFLLIGFWHERERGRYGAYQSLVVTALGGLALLAGVILLGGVAGSFEWPEVLAQRDAVLASPLFPAILGLILLGVFTKSGQFPFHLWIPNAMQAPTPVSAFLHSATMVKAGVFLLARLFPLFSGTGWWFYTVGIAGMATMAFAAYAALRQSDLKALLAYSTVSNLGMITALLGFGSEAGATAAVFHVINHAVFKASLFLSVGVVEHETGTRNLNRLGGLRRAMPWTATLATVSALAMAGVPLLNGFLSKELFLDASLLARHEGEFAVLFPLVATAASAFTMAYSLRFIGETFFGAPKESLPAPAHDPVPWMLVPVQLLVLACLTIGLAPNWSVVPFLGPAVTALLEHPVVLDVKLWHGVTPALLMSAAALTAGGLMYAGRRRVWAWQERLSPGIEANRVYDACVAGMLAGAAWLTGTLQSGSLRRYLWIGVSSLLVGAAAALLPVSGLLAWPALEAPPPTFVLFAAVMGAALAGVVTLRGRLARILSLGMVGTVTVLIYARASAPDLALTQLLIEVAVLLVLLLVLRRLPERPLPPEPRARRARDGLLSAAAGLGVATLLLLILAHPIEPISAYHLENSYAEAGGRNVVNVILVDFRGFDTLGEITVLVIGALAVWSLTRARRRET